MLTFILWKRLGLGGVSTIHRTFRRDPRGLDGETSERDAVPRPPPSAQHHCGLGNRLLASLHSHP